MSSVILLIRIACTTISCQSLSILYYYVKVRPSLKKYLFTVLSCTVRQIDKLLFFFQIYLKRTIFNYFHAKQNKNTFICWNSFLKYFWYQGRFDGSVLFQKTKNTLWMALTFQKCLSYIFVLCYLYYASVDLYFPYYICCTLY